MNVKIIKILFCINAVIPLSPLVFAADVTLKYQYDELGRMTVVKDPINGDRNYKYDPAGNRTKVTAGVTPVAIPSGSSCTWRSNASYGNGNQWGSYYEYPPVGPCKHRLKTVTRSGGTYTVAYK